MRSAPLPARRGSVRDVVRRGGVSGTGEGGEEHGIIAPAAQKEQQM